MPVFSKDLNALDKADVPGSLGALESYIAYMKECIEFSDTKTTKTLSASGTTTAEVVLILKDMQNTLSALTSTVSSLTGRISALETSAAALQTTVSALQTSVSTLQADLTALTARVKALEDKSA